ncbi:MAG: HK97 gp10 family phage protein [Eggerthellaceae bacterium]|nr:HK97 gp10 family phage protein [Eggerthellaceae bacterium]
MGNRTCGIDDFARSLEDILGDVNADVRLVAQSAVKESARKGRLSVRKHARKQGPHAGGLKITGEYIKGWTYKVVSTEDGYAAEIGNKRKPGLAHLLEKGHAKVGGGRDVPAYPHIADAAEETFEELAKQVMEGVDAL